MIKLGFWVAILGGVLAFWPWAADPFTPAKLACVLAGAALAHAGLAMRVRRGGYLRGGLERFPIKVWAIILAVICFTSCDPWLSIMGARASGAGSMLSCAAFALIFMAATSAGLDREDLYAPCAVAGALAGVYALAQKAGYEPFFQTLQTAMFNGRAYGSMGGPIYLGPALAVCLPPALALAYARPRAWAAACVLIVGGIVVSGTRSSMGAAAAGCVLMAWINMEIGARACAGAGVGAVILSVFSRPNAFISDHGRVEVWRIAFSSFIDRPLTGWGPDTFGLIMRRYIDPAFISAYRNELTTQGHAHNFFLQTAYAGGLLGLLGLLVAVPFIFLALLGSTRRDAPAISAGLICLLCAMTNPMPLIAWVVAALLMAPLFTKFEVYGTAWKPSLAALALSVGLLYPVQRILRAEAHAYDGMVAWNAQEGLRAGYAFNAAARAAPWDQDHISRQLDASRSLALWMPAWQAQQTAQDGLRIGLANVRRHPQDPHAYEALAAQEALSALIAGDALSTAYHQARARAWIRQAKALAPTFTPLEWRARMINLGMRSTDA